ncbi:MAG: hypothetical protein H6973_02105 [Gammaproteobacteria bacterium]|nr:hypothetical protein [Gammaproteobacteria bacterium]HRX71564.1 hypothetical protein [Candidatus Competibacteraceae bacterium]
MMSLSHNPPPKPVTLLTFLLRKVGKGFISLCLAQGCIAGLGASFSSALASNLTIEVSPPVFKSSDPLPDITATVNLAPCTALSPYMPDTLYCSINRIDTVWLDEYNYQISGINYQTHVMEQLLL